MIRNLVRVWEEYWGQKYVVVKNFENHGTDRDTARLKNRSIKDP